MTTENLVDIGMRASIDRRAAGVTRDVPEESLMLTGDENIVDVDFSVFWVIKDAPDFLFNIQNPTGTVKGRGRKHTMREIIGQNDIQPILTEQRQTNEEQVKALMQKTLDEYGAGITITRVKMQKVDPPAAVIDAFRDAAARADQERARNEANKYANRVVPEAQGEAVRIRREAEAYRAQTVAEADGEATRFASIYDEYRSARGVTRQQAFA